VSRRRLSFAGGAFGERYRRRLGGRPDLSALDASAIPAGLLEQARAVWQERARSEFRSIQILTRFLAEVTGAGDPLDVYAGVTELVDDEVRHTELCAALCEALGAPAWLPEPVGLVDPPEFLAAPMAERALATAITMLGINETISVGFIADLAARCRNPAVKRVLDETIGDEDEHQELGWSYIRQSLRRFPASTLPDWRHLVKTTLAPHEALAERTLGALPAEQQHLDRWPEPALADLGLFSLERQMLVYRKTWREVLAPRLASLELLPE
jgi:hypothetical protein